jgi:phosphoglycolate phosphatase-like HAD superfamily hydrolase
MTPAAILDVDGTLVDSNYQHAIAWFRAFREHGVTPPIWRIHRHIGMGGDQLVGAVAGDEVEAEHGDAIRDGEGRCYAELIGEVCPFEGAAELIATLAGRGIEVVLASSAKEDEVERYIELLGCTELISAYTTSDDVERTKPEPDLIHAALERIAGADAVMVGDSTWDVEAARRAGVPTIAVLTGGFSAAELEEAGAEAVYASMLELVGDLDATRFAAGGRG